METISDLATIRELKAQLTRMQEESNRQLAVCRALKAENRRLTFELSAVLEAVVREVDDASQG